MFNLKQVTVELAQLKQERFARSIVRPFEPPLTVEGRRLVERATMRGHAIVRKLP